MTDRIFVHRIAVFAYHGLFAEEAKLGQRFFISLTADPTAEVADAAVTTTEGARR